MQQLKFFDTHNHLDYVEQQTQCPLAELLHNAQQHSVEKILIVAVMAKDFKKIEKMTALYPQQLVYALGLHPLHLLQHQPEHLQQLAQLLAQRPKGCTAIGEIGLERAIPELITPQHWRKQCELLENQLQLAKHYALPVNIHSRKAHEQLVPFLKRADLTVTGVIHGFAGSYQQAKRFVDLGYKIGVGGTITYQRANKTRQTITKLPLESLLLETDSPDMPVFGFQGQPNRPERIRQIFEVLCQLRKEPAQHIAEVIWQQSCGLFAIEK
ncbi:TatD DNase family protein [Volucribacter psittacicida]|uniref:TatD DNase family protein n=1 Tax=Volucribacter psittacicida TaxID=203482 RepID=A0A4R1FXT0_9PAST|nr:TatD family hydrolase [Volucribacter psittacicida]TCJ98594.1 TatD DNase family protein [Volucribacter psittacicida]